MGAIMVVAPTAGALAADYVPPPVPVGHAWYLRGHIGMASQHFAGLDHPDFDIPAFFEWLDPGEFDAVPIFGIGVGVQASDHLRFDVTGEYRGKSAFTALDRYDADDNPPDFGAGLGVWGTNHYTGKKSEWLFLANGYVDLATWRGVTPYVGAGIGASYNTISDFQDDNVITGGQGWAPTGHQWNLAWAVHAGAGIQATNNLTVDIGYSFVNLGDAQTGSFQNVDPNIACLTPGCPPMVFKGIYSHDVKLGVRWAFDQTY
jgi:opacity protein-like surface antigen